MFRNLQKRWQVNSLQLLLVILTFALGGSCCGYIGRKLLLLTGMDKGVWWVILYILLITLLWPICVLIISIPLGQYRFFSRYVGRIAAKISGGGNQVTRVAIFASGAGSNAKKIIEYFAHSSDIKIELVVCNKPGAGVLKIAENAKIPTLLLEKEAFFGGNHYISELRAHRVDFIVLAGFLWKIPAELIREWPQKIVNIHPALLPKYGGKGMYGHHVHEAVLAAGEKESGISIHYVDELYDHGQILFQARCQLSAAETPETLAQKVHQLEHEHFPQEIEKAIKSQNRR